MRIAMVLLVALCACSSTGNPSLPDLGGSTVDLSGAPAPSCLPAGAQLVPFLSTTPERSFSKADSVLTTGKDYVALLETDAGCFAIDLLQAETPITTNSFVFLALHHFFDGLAFHRVIDGFMAQTGDPNSADGDRSSWGKGNPGYAFGLEVNATLNYDGAGVVGMARTNDPNSNGSQFFITFAAAPSLDQKYTVFGKLLDGAAALPQIVRGEPPATPTRITRASIAVK